MWLTVIGHWAPYPKTGEATSGYLLETEETRILLDCGHGVFSCLGNYVDYNILDAVFISHFHPDHYVDLYALRHALRGAFMLKKREEKLKLFIPEKPEREYEYFKGAPEFEVIEIKNRMKVEVKDINLEFVEMKHALPSYGLKVSFKEKALFYTGDTAFFTDFYREGEKVQLLLAECCLYKNEGMYAKRAGHMTTHDAGRMAEVLRADKLVATHFWPGYDIDRLRAEILEVHKGELIMAKAGLKIKV
ncbi:MBL fold metallo-hydrolase [Thermosyntropha sp.]|uniref:MBL fold metallo-hydrolase n=1 Tax=Thermosyntropha sp. TaxID=2740820 RepID=UPI0025DF2D25|nr:MBL fold metallo-hydrolase [Thermosyntropha sp.]MBO8159841.1 MBL fold metallo-hydrolase [Thermosyntropha sp.]